MLNKKLCGINNRDIIELHYTVLEPTYISVTGTPSISLELSTIITTSCLIHKWRSIYKQVIIDGGPVIDIPVTGIPVAPGL